MPRESSQKAVKNAMTANDNDSYAAQWLRNLIAASHVAIEGVWHDYPIPTRS